MFNRIRWSVDGLLDPGNEISSLFGVFVTPLSCTALVGLPLVYFSGGQVSLAAGATMLAAGRHFDRPSECCWSDQAAAP